MEYKILYQNRDGVRRTLVEDTEKPGQVKVHTQVDLDEILKGIERDREGVVKSVNGHIPTNRHVARIPLTIYEQSVHEQWDEAKWKSWLNDPQNSPFRVWQGRV